MPDNTKKSTIMVVDDTPANLKLIHEILQDAGYRVVAFPGGRQALDAAARTPPDLILLDIVMPELDGYEVARRFKQNPATAEIPILFITVRNEEDDLAQGFDAGAVDYLTKPVRPRELLARVATHLSLTQQKQEVLRKKKDAEALISMLCHDLANPLSAIAGFMELWEEMDETGLKAELRGRFRNSLNHALHIVIDARELHAAHFANHLNLLLEEVLLSDLVGESMQILQERIVKKELQFYIHIEPGLKIKVVPSIFVNSILNNLITNAIKFSSHGASIIVSSKTGSGSEVCLSVHDSGKGMSPQQIEKLFDLREISSSPGTDGEKGTGFGLPLVQHFVEIFGGRVAVESSLQSSGAAEHGTTVMVFLPAVC